MTKPRVLVTGATGLVGSAIVRALLGRKSLIRVLARDPERARSLFASRVRDRTPSIFRGIYHASGPCGTVSADDQRFAHQPYVAAVRPPMIRRDPLPRVA